MKDSKDLVEEYNRYYQMEMANEYNVIYAECMPLADEGDEVAQFYVGLCYYFGYGGVKDDAVEAYNWWSKAANQGLIDGYFGMAVAEVYYGGSPEIKAEGRESLRYLAEHDCSRAQCELGTCYYQGVEGFEKDKEQAFDWWTKAVEQNGYYLAYYNLALSILHDEAEEDDEEASEEDKEKAIRWALEVFEELCEQGHAPSLYELGWCYSHGYHVQQDDAKAAELWAEGVRHQSSKCAYVLGMCYILGRGVEQDKDAGMNLLKAAAMSGNKDAIDMLEKIGNF